MRARKREREEEKRGESRRAVCTRETAALNCTESTGRSVCVGRLTRVLLSPWRRDSPWSSVKDAARKRARDATTTATNLRKF